MRAEYRGYMPGVIHVDAEDSECVKSFRMTLEEATVLWASLSDAIRDAEDAMPDLLPCPHCGSGAAVVKAPYTGWTVMCKGCEASTMPLKDWHDAVVRWNRRVD